MTDLCRTVFTFSAISAIACGSPNGQPSDPSPNTATSGGSGGSAVSAGGSTASGGTSSTGGSTAVAGAGGGTTGGTSPGGSASGGTPAGGSSSGQTLTCITGTPEAGLPEGAPELEPGVWKDITPPSHVGYKGSNETMIAQGIAIDPCNPAIIYWCTTPFETDKGGLFRSTDAGSTWVELGDFDAPLHIRIDPGDQNHLYVGDGVRGGTQGFWVSTDGGETWTQPDGFKNAYLDAGQSSPSGMYDVYDVAVDPTDFSHILLSFHSPYDWNNYDAGAGILESKDGGETWIAHEPGGWGQGHSINFLYQPELGIGDSNTWLLGAQGAGHWRTTDAGDTWTQVSDNDIFHGGGDIYYTQAGVLYASGSPDTMRSTDNGATWEMIGPGATTGIHGDGHFLYSGPALGDNTPWYVSPEDDGQTWTPYNGGAQTWHFGGPFEIAFDSVNGILYSSNWEQGAMALKVLPP